MNPLAVASLVAGLGWHGLRRITVQPLRDVVVEILLRPKDARESLALNAAEVLVQHLALQLGIESVGLGFAQAKDLLEIGEGCGLGWAQAQPDPDGGAGARRNGSPVDTGRLRALMRTDRVLVAAHQIIVETVLAQMSCLFASEDFCDIGLVLAELDLVRPVEVDRIGAERLMLDHDIVPCALERGL